MRFSSVTMWGGVVRSWRSRTSFIPALFIAVAFIMLAIALAGPRTVGGRIESHRDGISIMLAVDKSVSMLGLDMSNDESERTRMDVLKSVIVDFVRGDGKALKGRVNDALGMISFAGFPDTEVPLTLDSAAVADMASELEVVELGVDEGTNIGDSLALAVERLSQAKTKTRIIILVSDGAHNTGSMDPIEAAKLAEQEGIKVYTIGVGKSGRTPIRIPDPSTGRSVVRMVHMEFDEATLKEIAEMTGGKYYRAGDQDQLRRVYAEIDQLEKTKISAHRYVQYNEHFEWFVWLAMLLMALSLLLRATVYRRAPA